MTTLICGYVALQMLRIRNEDWDLPRLSRLTLPRLEGRVGCNR